MRSLSQGQMNRIVAAAFGAIGILCLWLWLRAGREPVLFWYGVSGVTLLVVTALGYISQWHPEFVGWRVGLVFMRYHGYLVPFFILHLRLAGRRHFWLESALWLALVVAFFSVAQPNRWGATAWVGWGLVFAALPALLTVPLLMSPRLRTRPEILLLVVADFAASFLPLHDWAVRFGLLDFDRPLLVFFAPPFVMLAAAVPIVERMLAGARATERNRLELERRVADKAREIEASHAHLRAAQREQEIADERRRIMADMHDGLGARLVSLLSIAQSGKAKDGEISEGITAALDELRLTVDSVQPVEGDVGVVLGNVRHRMRSVFERAGTRLVWNVSALPRMDNLTPERILAIQRIFLEVFSNAIRHAGARTVSVFSARVPGAVRIVIEDDGRGFDPAAHHAGTGLRNLRMRAMQAGGKLSVDSKTGGGTRVTFWLPLEGEDMPESPPYLGRTPRIAPFRG
jgi:signal transduction histidine kinase